MRELFISEESLAKAYHKAIMAIYQAGKKYTVDNKEFKSVIATVYIDFATSFPMISKLINNEISYLDTYCNDHINDIFEHYNVSFIFDNECVNVVASVINEDVVNCFYYNLQLLAKIMQEVADKIKMNVGSLSVKISNLYCSIDDRALFFHFAERVANKELKDLIV